MHKLALRILPYAACIAAACLFYVAATFLTGNLQGLVLNVSAAFLSIPFLFLIYEVSRSFAHKRLNKEIFDYAKMMLDRQMLSIINQLSKLIYQYDKRDASLIGVGALFKLGPQEIRAEIGASNYLGFQVFKNWAASEGELHDILKNALILQRLNDEQIICIITLLKAIRSLESLQNAKNIYLISDIDDQRYRIQGGRELNERNSKFPDRYLLLEQLQGDRYLVADFGDFPAYQLPHLLRRITVTPEFLDTYSEAVYAVIRQIDSWLKLTGGEFLVDTKMFRLGVGAYPKRSRGIDEEKGARLKAST